MTSRADRMREKLLATLQATRLEVIDESAAHAGHAGAAPGGETHYRVRIASPLFEGRSRVEKHRLVYDALQDDIAQGVHALAIEIL